MKKLKTVFNKKISYSKPNERRGEQYTLGLPVDILEDMGISESERNVTIFYNPKSKELKIKKL